MKEVGLFHLCMADTQILKHRQQTKSNSENSIKCKQEEPF